MSAYEVCKKVNQCVDDLDFVAARKMMEDHFDMLVENKHRLQRNAKDLFEFVEHSDGKLLTQEEIQLLHAMNRYATSFDIRAFKLMVKEHAGLVSREDTQTYLNEDAKALLESMHVLKA